MLQGKTALITGAAKGIGRAIALEMAKNGANIAVNYVASTASAEKLKAELLQLNVKCEIYPCDVSDFLETKKMTEAVLKDFGCVDILVNNAGITHDNLVVAMDENGFDRVLDVNLKGAFNMMKHFYPHFVRNRAGTIINLASVVGIMGQAGQLNYAASKGGLIAATKSLAKELGGRGVTCNAIAPGLIETEMTEKLSDEVKQRYIAAVPMRRVGQAAEVAALAVFLASAGARYITGEVIKVDGGLCM